MKNRVDSAIRLLLLAVCVLIAQAYAQTVPPVVYTVDAFAPEGSRGFSYSGGKIGSVWSNWFGAAFQSLSWDAASDADGNTGSGSMKILANFPGSGSNQFTVINGFNGISPSVSARQFTALECDVRFAPGSASYLRNGAATFGYVEFGMATPSYGQLYFGGAYVPATETGWVHIKVPLDPATNPNLLKINNVMVHIWGGTSLVGASTLWVDNLKFTGTTITDTATVNYANARQTIDGFGASSAWNSTWSSAEADLFFSTGPGGIGLSLLRSRITPEGTTWETNIMKMAQARGAKVWSAPWTPPASYKDSNSVNGGNLIGNPTNYQNYANQLANYVASMKTAQGVNLEAISVQNEPNASTTYESCVWTPQQIHDFVPYLADALAARGVASTKIMLPESMHWEFSLAVPTMDDPATAQHVGILGGHNYGSSAAAVTQFGTPPPVPLWETEHYIETGGDTISNGLALAQEIHDFMTVAEANAYHYWWLRGSGTGSLAGDSTTNPAKRLYVMGNYSKFVRPGFQRVTVASNTTALITAYKNPATLDFVIVAANPTAWPVTQTFNLASCPSVTSLDRWVTTDTLSLSSQSSVNVTAGAFTTDLPPYSVTTYTSVAATSPVIALKTDDAYGSTSFNAVGNWNDTVAPTSAKDYTTAQYVLRTPSTAGNYTFGGHSLTLPSLGILRFKGGNNDIVTIANLTLDGGSIENGNGGTAFTLAGNLSVTADSILYPAGDTRTIHVASELEGTGSLTCGNGGPGTVSLSGNNDSYTGSIIVNGGCILKAGSQANLGGNPGSFHAGQLTLANGIFQPTAGFEMNRPNGGVTLGTGGGTFSINSGITFTISNPVSGDGGLTKTGSGSLFLNGTNSHSGTTTVSAGNLTVSGLDGNGAVTVDSTATFGGSGEIAGNTTIHGTLAPSATGLTFTGSLGFGATAKTQWNLGGNSLATAGNVTAAAVNVTGGVKIDVVLNSSGSTTNFLHSFWRSPRSFPVISASAMTGSFTLGAVTADAGGRPVATYGAFTLQNSASGVNLVWTPIPGFPSIDDPTLALTSPSVNQVSIPSNTLSLRLNASITGGAGTMITWSQVSGPGTATFENPAAADTRVSFPADGTYVLRGTVTNAVGSTSQDITVIVTIGYSVNQTPALATGTAPAAQTGVAAVLGGSTTHANSSLWSQVSGPGTAVFGDAAQAATTVTFSHPGEYRLRLSAVNAFGETSSTLTVNVQDLTPPAITVPSNMTVEATSAAGAVVTFSTSAVDAVSGPCPTTNTPASGSVFPLGTTAVTAIASDGAGNPASQTFTVTVTDTTAPVITVPSNLTVEASSSAGAVVTFSTSATDAVSGPCPTTNTPASGSTFPLGTTTVTVTASDAAGNPASQTFTVTITAALPADTFAEWAGENFTSTELADPSISGPDATPAGDGLSNLLKYALGLPPKIPSTAGVKLASPSGTWLLTYNRPANRPDISYAVEVSSALDTGSWTTEGVTHIRTTEGDPETWQATAAPGAPGRLFFRLRVSKL